MSPPTQVNASPITKLTSWLKFLGKNLHLVGCATLWAKSEVMLLIVIFAKRVWCNVWKFKIDFHAHKLSNFKNEFHANFLHIMDLLSKFGFNHRLQPLHRCTCALSLCSVIMYCHYSLSLCIVIVHCHCILTLSGTTYGYINSKNN